MTVCTFVSFDKVVTFLSSVTCYRLILAKLPTICNCSIGDSLSVASTQTFCCWAVVITMVTVTKTSGCLCVTTVVNIKCISRIT